MTLVVLGPSSSGNGGSGWRGYYLCVEAGVGGLESGAFRALRHILGYTSPRTTRCAHASPNLRPRARAGCPCLLICCALRTLTGTCDRV
jgi:hypothetical protein